VLQALPISLLLQPPPPPKKNIFLNDAIHHYSIYLSLYVSMALQPFVRLWPLFQFLDLLHSR
jgi:hypothetical protein